MFVGSLRSITVRTGLLGVFVSRASHQILSRRLVTRPDGVAFWTRGSVRGTPIPTPARMTTRERPPHTKNRGARAWDAVQDSGVASIWAAHTHPEVSPLVSRAHVHAVADVTNDLYLPAVKAALRAIETGIFRGRWPRPTSVRELDLVLTALVDFSIYVEHREASFGSKLHAAWGHV